MIRKSMAAALLCVTVSAFSFAQEVPSFSADTQAVSDGLNAFSLELLDVVPNVAVQQGVWADAWIGKLVPSVPPHLGGGLTVGIARLDPDGLNTAIDALNVYTKLIDAEIPSVPDSLVLPTLTADLRIGGIFLPFDLGISVMRIPTIALKMLGSGLTLDFFTIGGSVRVPVMQGNVILPKISLGAGFMYSKGAINVSAEEDMAYVSADFDTKTVFLEAQVSKTFFIVTPFVGFRGLLSESDNNWAWACSVSAAGNTLELGKGAGSVSRSFGDDFTDNLQYQVYGGVSLNILVIQTTVAASYDMKSGVWGGNLSLRVKI